MDGDDLEELEANENLTVQQGPSAEAIAKFTDYSQFL